MCSWAYWGIFLAWALMTWNWFRMAKLQKKTSDDYDNLAEITDGLLAAMEYRMKGPWN